MSIFRVDEKRPDAPVSVEIYYRSNVLVTGFANYIPGTKIIKISLLSIKSKHKAKALHWNSSVLSWILIRCGCLLSTY